uniref:LuxR C-terminal-related transcriptional regulator n=2 Tax=Pseudomonadota TaxID=1224 RepID=UPI0039881451
MQVFITESQPLMRQAVVKLFHKLSNKAIVVGLASHNEITAASNIHGQPDLICLDLSFSNDQDASTIRELRDKFPDSTLMVFSATEPAVFYQEVAIKAGANAFINKLLSIEDISNRLCIFFDGEINEDDLVGLEKLSNRQKQLLVLLDKGMNNKSISESLAISEHTVKVHLWRLFKRLNVHSRAQASHIARTRGLV